jgi:(2Fe-2S) ferredoxin
MKKALVSITILIALMLIAVGCTPPQTPTPSDLKEVVITLERTECFGTCPVYSLTVYGYGAVIYEGIRFAQVQGTIQTTISEDKIIQLVSEFQKIDYFSLRDSYEERNATDMPSALTSLTIDGRKKTIRHYHGDFSAPKELTELEDKIDEIIDTDQWIKSPLQ